MDVSRALLLPEMHDPSDKLLKNLALYWDEVVVPVDRGGESRALFEMASPASETYVRLREDFGVIRELKQPVFLEDVLPPSDGHEQQPEGTVRVLAMTTDAAGNPKFDRYLYVPEEVLAQAEQSPTPDNEFPLAASGLIADVALLRLSRARAYAASQNLAPLAYSFLGHVGSLASPPEPDLPLREAALISATSQLFEIDDAVPLEDVVRLRERHRHDIARLRAALGDLAESLRQEDTLDHLMSRAHDVVRNRVEPAVGALGAALDEKRITYTLKALFGASTLVALPATPAALAATGPIVAQSLQYRFSREAMVRDHPFGFLHRLNALPKTPRPRGTAGLAGVEDPRQMVYQAVAALALTLGH